MISEQESETRLIDIGFLVALIVLITAVVDIEIDCKMCSFDFKLHVNSYKRVLNLKASCFVFGLLCCQIKHLGTGRPFSNWTIVFESPLSVVEIQSCHGRCSFA